MALIPHAISRDPWFRLGLLVRVACVVLLVPLIQQQWFVLFLTRTLEHPSLDPWGGFLRLGGDPQAFPYGPVMYLAHAPFVAVGMLLDSLARSGHALAQVGFGVSLLSADLALLVTLERITLGRHTRQVILFYWWSPIAIFITYWHGQTDVVPTFLVALSLLMLQRRRLVWSGGTLGLGIAAKLSCVIGLPFILVFLWVNRRYRPWVARFMAALLITVVLAQGPWLLLAGPQAMVLGSPEMGKIYDVAVSLADGTRIFIMPLTYLLLIYAAWRIGRMNMELLFGFLGVSFMAILLLTPASFGWYFWVLPFLVIYQLRATRGGAAIGVLFAICFVLVKGPVATGARLTVAGGDFGTPFVTLHPGILPAQILSLGITTLTALGLVLASAIVNRALAHNDFYHLSRRPLLIGIAGDSGTGKDTLSAALAGLLGENAVASVSGDDYHLFERRGPLWQSLTHLDPRANDLRGFSRDVLQLLAGQAVRARHYDHATGLFTHRRLIGANDVVLASGLHALQPPSLRRRMDVAIFLDMDEDLRRHFKIERDVNLRGHALDQVLASLERRQADFLRHVAPQAATADLAFSLQPATPDFATRPSPWRLRVRMRDPIEYGELARVLIGLATLKVDQDLASTDGLTELWVEGDIAAEDVAFAAATLVPHLEELLPIAPGWQGGMSGIMQLCVLMRIAEKMQQRG